MRTLISDTISKIGESVTVSGWLNTRRDHGKIVFLDLRDRSGILQVVVSPQLAEGLHVEDVISITGTVSKRPDKLVNPKLPTGTVELQASEIEVLSHAAELPFDMGQPKLEVELPTLLDYRSLTLRHPEAQAIFQVQAALAEGFRQAARQIGCIEVFPPTISASATEGGTEVLPVDYFGHSAFLVQSPQLYKQMMVGVYERVFIVTHIYRAEPSVTTRHLVESIQLDCEIGFIESFEDLLDSMEQTFASTIAYAQNHSETQLQLLGVAKSLVESKIPRFTMREAQQIIFERTGIDHRTEKDLMPEDEREICAYVKEKFASDLVTITHFPTKKRAFYSLPDPADPEYSLSFDLLYKGLEICSGAQRIHNYDQLLQTMHDRGLNPDNFAMYLQSFKYGMPPHGGFSFGLERSTMKLLDLDNIRRASLYPRDLERVDFRFSSQKSDAPVESPYEKIISKLKDNHIEFQHYEHEPVFTSEDSARVRGTSIHQGAKALVLQGDNKLILFVLPADLKADLEKIKTELGFSKVAVVSKDTVKAKTGLEVGSIPPFGSVINLPTYIDSRLSENDEIAFNTGRHDRSVKMKYSDYLKIENPHVLNI